MNGLGGLKDGAASLVRLVIVTGTGTGTISPPKRPFSWALDAQVYDVAPKTSRSALLIPYLLATYSLLMPNQHDAIARVLHPTILQLWPQLRPQLCRHSFGAVVSRHIFRACTNTYIYPSYGNTVGDGSDGLRLDAQARLTV